MLASDFQTSHQIMQVPRRLQNLCRELSLWGLTQISWGSIGLCGVLSRRTTYAFEPLRPLYQATHLLKITARLLITYYSISYYTFLSLHPLPTY